METKEKLALIYENLAEILNPEILEKPLKEGRNPKIYWVSLYPGKTHNKMLANS
jgi:tyrosyl-tRNA synthetase